jgi:hypothetical protein
MMIGFWKKNFAKIGNSTAGLLKERLNKTLKNRVPATQLRIAIRGKAAQGFV